MLTNSCISDSAFGQCQIRPLLARTERHATLLLAVYRKSSHNGMVNNEDASESVVAMCIRDCNHDGRTVQSQA